MLVAMIRALGFILTGREWTHPCGLICQIIDGSTLRVSAGDGCRLLTSRKACPAARLAHLTEQIVELIALEESRDDD